MSGKSERRNASVRSGTLKSAGGAALGICGETVVGLLFWAREYRAPMKGTHRSNPRKSALERLQYLSRSVTSREKPSLDGSLRRIIQESRMMRAFAEASRSHRSVICVYQRISFVTTENLGRSADFRTTTNQEKCLRFRQSNKRANGSVKVMRIIYLFHLITSPVCLESWGTLFGIAQLANGLTRELSAVRFAFATESSHR